MRLRQHGFFSRHHFDISEIILRRHADETSVSAASCMIAMPNGFSAFAADLVSAKWAMIIFQASRFLLCTALIREIAEMHKLLAVICRC